MNTTLRSSLAGLAEATLIEMAQQGTDDGVKALGQLVMQHRGDVLAIVATFDQIPAADREDLFQQVWIFIYHNINRFTGKIEFRAWIIGVTRKTCEKSLKVEDPLRGADRNVLEDNGDDETGSSPLLNSTHISEGMFGSEMSRLVTDSMDILCEDEREVVELIMQGDTLPEIAKKMGWSPSKAFKKKWKAFRRLQSYIGSRTSL